MEEQQVGTVSAAGYGSVYLDEDVRRADTIIMRLRRNRSTCLYSSCILLGPLCAGYQSGIAEALKVNPGFIARVGEAGLGAGGAKAFNPQHEAGWTGAHSGAYLLISLLAWIVLDGLGRKKGLLAAQALFLINVVIELFAGSWIAWTISSILAGLASGLTQCAVITYLSEISPAGLRGSILAACYLTTTLGSFLATTAMQILILTAPNSYRNLLLSQLGCILPTVFLIAICPESPTWFVSRGDDVRAVVALGKLCRSDTEFDAAAALRSLEDERGRVAMSLDFDRDEGSESRLSDHASLRRLFVSFFVLAWQQWLGIPVIHRYATHFFQLADLIEPFTGTIILQTLAVVAAFAAVCLVEIIGRRRLVLVGGTIAAGTLFAVGGLTRHAPGAATGPVLVFLTCLWTTAYAMSAGPVALVYLGECSSLALRAKTVSLAVTGAGLFHLVADYATPPLLAIKAFGLTNTAHLFGLTASLGVIVCYFCLPETKGRSYHELDLLFGQEVPARQFRAAHITTRPTAGPGDDHLAAKQV